MDERIPPRIDFGNTIDSTLNALLDNYEQHKQALKSGGMLYHDTASRYACGYPVPPFQRQLVWTDSQKVAFIESLWLGINPGSYTLHDSAYIKGGQPKKYSGWIIDGQQRITTIQQYVDGEFEVFGLLYPDLTPQEKRRFRMVKFTHTVSALWDEDQIKRLYNLMAFGGTSHRPEEMA